MNDLKVSQHGDATITTSSSMKKGIFFRNPFFKKYYSLDAGFFDDLTPAPELKNLGLIHRLLNSRKTIAELIDFVENDDNAAGFKLCELRSPIFFEREERYAQLNSPNGVTIISKGWNFVDEEVGGACEVERTWVYRGGELIKRLKQTGSYKFTYEHVLKDATVNLVGV